MKKLQTKNHKLKTTKGFTLIEMMVAVSLFSVVMLISTGSLLSLIDASKRAQAIQSIMSNMNTSLDGMVRAMRMGQAYSVSDDGLELSFTPFGKDPNVLGDRWTYSFVEYSSGPGEARGRLYKKYRPYGFISSITVPLTSENVDIDYVKFYKSSDVDGDTRQPRVVMIVQGKAGFGKRATLTKFNIQASATQRLLDI